MDDSLYKKKVDWLFNQFPAFQKIGNTAFKPTLDNTRKLVSVLNVPIEKMKFIHIAGTNGKGTTCSIIASTLTESGKKVGLFTSPHIKDFRERIRINGEMISEEEVVNYISKFQELKFTISPSFFEMSWVMALSYFYQKKCDIIVVETGLGGRLDATNIIHPILTIITNIGLDHTAILGDTREQIANEKAGIIKAKIPIIIGESDKELDQIFRNKAKKEKAPILFISKETDSTVFEHNKQVAFTAIDDFLLKDTPKLIRNNFKKRAIDNLWKNSGWIVRKQIYSINPLIILDVAHNQMGVERLIHDIQMEYPTKQIRALYGASNDKNILKIIQLFPKGWIYYISEFKNKRSTTIEEFKQIEHLNQLNISYFNDVKKAFQIAKESTLEDELLLVFGSFYLLEEII